MEKLYLPWKCDSDGNITCSASLDLLRNVGTVDPELARLIVIAVNNHDWTNKHD